MTLARKLMGTAVAADTFTAIEDVFSTSLYTGNSSTQTITNGIDLAGEGGMVWIKSRSQVRSHSLFDTERGATKRLLPDNPIAEQTVASSLTSFNSDGFSLGSSTNENEGDQPTASWTYRKAPRFFDVVTYTGDGSASKGVSHGLSTTVGTIIVIRTDEADNGQVYHRSVGALSRLKLESVDAAAATDVWADTSPNSDTFYVGHSSNINGGTYVAYLFAHDPLGPSGDGSDGLIACGSYHGNSLNDGPSINLGWEPQFVLVKKTDTGPWITFDTMRGMPNGGNDAILYPHLSDAEQLTQNFITPTATGFKIESADTDINSNFDYIYIAIRRGPMRQPESGTEVFAVALGGSATTNGPVTGFVTDLQLLGQIVGSDRWYFSPRLTGGKYMRTNLTDAESLQGNLIWDRMDGVWNNQVSPGYNLWGLARAPGFLDVVAYTGDGIAGRTVSHNLGVAPELMIVKRRDAVDGWPVYAAPTFGNTTADVLYLNESNAAGVSNTTTFNNTDPTDSVFYVGTSGSVNASSGTYIAYLFATLPGISKVGSYTGNGTSQTIDCGFTSGARFVLIKRTDSTGDWFVWDTARGIVAANDPHLSLNTTAAEVTTDDSVDPDGSGFIVNQVAATNINVSAASYIYLAIS